jgi:hypothetical protein
LRSTCTWPRGQLRPFESVGSFGAKYCFFNKLRPSQFVSFFNQFLDPDSYSGEIQDKALAAYLNESIVIVRTLSFPQFYLPENLEKLSNIRDSVEFEKFAYCPQCLADGFHSTLHQTIFSERCFIHDCQLLKKSHPPLQYVIGKHPGVRVLQSLFEVWFSSESAGTYFHHNELFQKRICNRVIWKAGRRHLAKINRIEKQLSGDCHGMVVIGHQDYKNLAHIANVTRVRLKPIGAREIRTRKLLELPCSSDQAKAMINLPDYYLERLFHLRHLTCMNLENPPEWFQILTLLERALVAGHEGCLKLLQDKTYVPDTVDGKTYYLKIPFNRDWFYLVPCLRITTLTLLQELLEVEKTHVFSQCSINDLTFASRQFWEVGVWEDLAKANLLSWHLASTAQSNIYFDDENKYYGGYPRPGSRTGQWECYVPQGVLAQLIDEMLLAYIWSWCWALYRVEQNAGKTQYPRISPSGLFADYRRSLEPVFSLIPSSTGINFQCSVLTPFKMPPWGRGLRASKLHIKRGEEHCLLMAELAREDGDYCWHMPQPDVH